MLSADDVKGGQQDALGLARSAVLRGDVATAAILSMLVMVSEQIADLAEAGALPPLPPSAFGLDGGTS